MASFTERYHELTKYNPHTIDKLGTVRWDSQPPTFKSIHAQEKVDLLSRIQAVMDQLQSGENLAAITSPASPASPASPGSPADTTDAKNASSLENIAKLLFFTLGLTARFTDQGGGDFFLRAAPSAGGLYPTEIYIAARNQNGLADGIYHYHSLKSALIPVWQGKFWADLNHYFLNQPQVEASNLIFIFTGIYGRSAWRYKERAYRRILLDTGHAVGNLLEVCRASQLDYSLLGGFQDQGLEELLFLTSKEEFPLLAVAIGPAGSLPTDLGQYPSAFPADAIKQIQSDDSMQVQQNACERILATGTARPIVGSEVILNDHKTFSPGFEIDIFKTILNRRSCRKFDGSGVTLLQLKENLAYAFRDQGHGWSLSQSALDFHVVALNVVDAQNGIYHFHPTSFNLELQTAGDFKYEALFMCLGQELAIDCAFILVHTANLSTLVNTYGDRGYRYACLDAGQIGERMNLFSIKQGLGSSGIGGYYDDKVNELLGLPLTHGILYISLVGVPEKE